MNIYKTEKYGTLERIAELLENHGITQKDLADKTGISERSISRWKTGTPIRRSNLERIAEVLECDVEFLECTQDTPRKKTGSKMKLSVLPTEKYLPKIQELIKTTTQRFEYSIEVSGNPAEMITGSYIEGDTRYYYETLAPTHEGDLVYKISVNGADPVEKTESEMMNFIKSVMKFISFEISQF